MGFLSRQRLGINNYLSAHLFLVKKRATQLSRPKLLRRSGVYPNGCRRLWSADQFTARAGHALKEPGVDTVRELRLTLPVELAFALRTAAILRSVHQFVRAGDMKQGFAGHHTIAADLHVDVVSEAGYVEGNHWIT
jgi:hypothetical protein